MLDLVLQAHSHNYQRIYPIKYNDKDPSNPIITDKNKANMPILTAHYLQ